MSVRIFVSSRKSHGSLIGAPNVISAGVTLYLSIIYERSSINTIGSLRTQSSLK